MLRATGDTYFEGTQDPAIKGAKPSFQPITLRRRLRHFHQALGLTPGRAGTPDPDFLVHLIEGCGHQELLRKAVRGQFRNLENFLRGSHTPTATTWALFMRTLEIDDETLRGLAHGHKDGPLLPVYIAAFELLENAFSKSFRSKITGKVHCPRCRADMLDDTLVWWTKQDLSIPSNAAAFVERILFALLGGVLLLELPGRWLGFGYLAIAEAVSLATPDQHPIGNWMAMVRRHRALQHDWQLTVGEGENASGPEGDGLLRKWRCGQVLLPMEKALSMIEPVTDTPTLKHALFVARTLSLAIDVVRAAAVTHKSPSRAAAQQIVYARVQQLHQHFRIASATEHKLEPVASEIQ